MMFYGKNVKIHTFLCGLQGDLHLLGLLQKSPSLLAEFFNAIFVSLLVAVLSRHRFHLCDQP